MEKKQKLLEWNEACSYFARADDLEKKWCSASLRWMLWRRVFFFFFFTVSRGGENVL